MSLSLWCIGFLLVIARTANGYEPTWASLDTRPVPEWYEDSKIGIMIGWGVYSVPALHDEWFWYDWKTEKKPDCVQFMEKNYPPGFTYADFASQFKASFYNPDDWADLFKAAGARYVVLVSKHHEGYTLWPSKYAWNWNAMDVGPGRDLVGELAASIRNRTNIHFGMYHSLYEWYNPLYLEDKANRYTTQKFVRAKTIPELYEMVEKYRPELIWSDGDWEAADVYWNSTYFLAWLYNESPVKDTIVVNDRWGNNTRCEHGGYWNCDDRYNPGHKMPHKWEMATTIDKHAWAWRRNAVLDDFLTMDDITQLIAEVISCGGNLLLNVGPTADGTIPVVYEERLRAMGAWLEINGEAIYGSRPWVHQNDTVTKGVWYTSKTADSKSTVYAVVLDWPGNGILALGSVKPASSSKITMLGHQEPLKWTFSDQLLHISFPPLENVSSRWAWTLKISPPTFAQPIRKHPPVSTILVE